MNSAMSLVCYFFSVSSGRRGFDWNRACHPVLYQYIERLFYYSHSIVKNSLQFDPVCRSLSQFVLFTPSLKNCRKSIGSNLGHGFQAILDILWGHAGSRQHKRSCLAHHAGESRLCCSAAVLKQDPLRIGVLPHVLCPLSEHGFVTGDVVEDFGPTGDDGLAAPLLAC